MLDCVPHHSIDIDAVGRKELSILLADHTKRKRTHIQSECQIV